MYHSLFLQISCLLTLNQNLTAGSCFFFQPSLVFELSISRIAVPKVGDPNSDGWRNYLSIWRYILIRGFLLATMAIFNFSFWLYILMSIIFSLQLKQYMDILLFIDYMFWTRFFFIETTTTIVFLIRPWSFDLIYILPVMWLS